jgi:hypothetical protein
MNGRVVGIYLLVKCRWLALSEGCLQLRYRNGALQVHARPWSKPPVGRFRPKAAVSTESLGLRSNLPDDDVVAFASEYGHLLVASNRRDFVRDAAAHVAKSSKKPNGCCRVPGMILLVPNDEITQRRVLHGLQSRLVFEGKPITFADVHHEDLLVTVEATGEARVSRLPRCPHCSHYILK